MSDQITASILSLLAQTTPLTAPASGGASPPLMFWGATLLVGGGLAIIGVVIPMMLRGRKLEQSMTDASEYDTVRTIPAANAPPALATEQSERAAAPRPISSPAFAASQQTTPTTLEAQNLLRLMGEAEELCTRLGRELDDKAQRIERLLARAEGRLGSDFATQSALSASTAPHTPRAPMPAAQPIAAPRPEIVTRPVGVPAPTPFAFTGPSPYYNSVPTATQPVPQGVPTRIASLVTPLAVPHHSPQPQHSQQPQHVAPNSADPFGIDPLTRDIYTLSDAGHSAQAIAQQLGQHTGKVELILALRPG